MSNALEAKNLHNLNALLQMGDPVTTIFVVEVPGLLKPDGTLDTTSPEAFNKFTGLQLSVEVLAEYLDTRAISRDILTKDITTLSSGDSFLGFTEIDREQFGVTLSDLAEFIRQRNSDLGDSSIPTSDIVNGTDIFVIQRDTGTEGDPLPVQLKVNISGVSEYTRHKLVDNTTDIFGEDVTKDSRLFILVDPEYDKEYKNTTIQDISWLTQIPGYGNERQYGLGDLVSIDGTVFICLDTLNQEDTFTLIDAGCSKADPQLSWVYDNVHPEAEIFRSYFAPKALYEQGLMGSVSSAYDLEMFYPKFFTRSNGQLITSLINEEMLQHITDTAPERLIGDEPDVVAYTETDGLTNIQFTLLRKIKD